MNRRLVLVILASAAVIFILGVALMPFALVTYDVTDYGDIALYNENTLEEIDTATTLNVQDGDWMVAWLRDDPTTTRKPTDIDLEIFSADLYLGDGSTSGTWIEDGRDREEYAGSYRWWLDLDQCPQGTFTYFVKYFARLDANTIVKGNSFAFQITNTEAPVYNDAEITVRPVDVGFDTDESPAYVQWTFSYEGPCTASVTLDGTEVDSQTYAASGVDQIFGYFMDTSVAGTFEVVFTVTPDDGSSPAVSDTVSVTVAESTTTPTTTTDTETTTTDTGTTTTTTTDGDDDEILEPDYLWIYLLIGVVMIALVIKVAR